MILPLAALSLMAGEMMSRASTMTPVLLTIASEGPTPFTDAKVPVVSNLKAARREGLRQIRAERGRPSLHWWLQFCGFASHSFTLLHEPRPKLGPYLATLEAWLEAEEKLPAGARRSASSRRCSWKATPARSIKGGMALNRTKLRLNYTRANVKS